MKVVDRLYQSDQACYHFEYIPLVLFIPKGKFKSTKVYQFNLPEITTPSVRNTGRHSPGNDKHMQK